MTEKRLVVDEDYNIVDTETGCAMEIEDMFNLVNKLSKENEQLKRFILKIDFAIIRKYNNSLENLLDEIYDGEIGFKNKCQEQKS